jgi:hypothetical protein
MNTRNGLDVEAILSGLYESGSTPRSHGFGTAGSMRSSEIRSKRRGWAFATIGEAVAWLRDQACTYYPDSGFARKYGGFV